MNTTSFNPNLLKFLNNRKEKEKTSCINNTQLVYKATLYIKLL